MRRYGRVTPPKPANMTATTGHAAPSRQESTHEATLVGQLLALLATFRHTTRLFKLPRCHDASHDISTKFLGSVGLRDGASMGDL
jgi:hypothetical protein